LMYFHS